MIIKNEPLSKIERRNLIDAWAKLNSLCGFLETPQHYTKKYNALKEARKIWKKLDSVVSKLHEDDL